METIKWIFKIFLSIVLLIVIAYGSFPSVIYVTGNKFVDYLKENSQTVSLGEAFNFDEISDHITNADFVLVGEIHGFHEPQLFDYNFFTYLHRNQGYQYYLAVVDLVQAHYLNTYLQTDEEEYLTLALRNWALIQGRRNESYYDKLRKLRDYNSKQDTTEQFQFIGIDKLQDLQLTVDFF